MKIIKQLKLTLILFFICNLAVAGKIDLLTGFYSFSGKSGNRSSSVSGLGIYEMSYLGAFKDQFEFMAGYSLTMTGIIGGDMSYGAKLGINYYPFNFSSDQKIELDGKEIEVHDNLKPYLGIGFNQRQFQSVRNAYAGLGITVGCEKYINPKYTLRSEVKFNTYSGSSNSTASEINVLVGLVFGF